MELRIKKVKDNSLFDFILFLCISVFMWIIIGFCTASADYNNYKLFYGLAKIGKVMPGIEYGYYLFMRFCCLLGFDFSQFLMLYGACGILIFSFSIIKFTPKAWIALLIFIFFPYFHIVATFRNFMSWALITLAIGTIINKEENSIHRKIFFILIILFASSFHVLSLFYLILLMIDLPYKKIHKIAIFMPIVSGIFLLINNSFINRLSIFIPKILVYTSQGMNGTRLETKIFVLLYFAVKIYLCDYVKKYIPKHEKLIKLNLLSSLILPFVCFNMNFMRMEYDIVFFMIVMIFVLVKECCSWERVNKRIIYISLIFFTYYLISGYILLYLFSYESIVRTIFEGNSLLF